ncbi:lysozyme inhibitor LprI family protein [Shewanella benthica]|uniref:Ribose-5-phosphate isomerase A n=1 Tax=Shewanella benthica KT99 TaxID=314608 RepID=A9D8I3_9GAMM|nr:lysozyme inhibitor LprI family protein [Shewanella benthica]EDQ00986.1 ribose-5-phosphate isomerase A [Shewanella benthica KT99]
MKYSLILLIFVSAITVAKSQSEVCDSKYKSKYDVETCINNVVNEKRRELKVVLSEVNAIVVAQEEYHISPGLSKEFKIEQESFQNYMNSHCSLYLGAIGANMGTGSAIFSLKCEEIILSQRIEALRIITK